MVGQNGGSAFVLLYLFLCLTLGLSLFLAEIALGKITKKDLANSLYLQAKYKPNLFKFGGIFMLSGLFVLSFYLVILAWVFRYIFISFSELPMQIDQAANLFNITISADLFSIGLCFLVCFLLTIYTVSKGIINGIEKMNIILMPALFVILLILLAYAITQDGFKSACEFLFVPDFSKLGLDSLLNALGLSLFTLCLGIGCISTYAASLDEDTNILKSSIFVVFINLLIGLMMGLIVFSFVFTYGANPNESGAGLVFISLTTLFAKLGLFGNILSFLFFVALFFAGITSAVSMIEPFTFYLQDKIGRKKALVFIGIFVFILSFTIILGMNGYIKFDMFSFLDFLTSNILLPMGVLFTAIFTGFFMKRYSFFRIFIKLLGRKITLILFMFIKFVAPILIILIMLNNFYPLKDILM